MMILFLLFALFFIKILVALTEEFSWLGVTLLAVGLAYIAYEFLPWAYILPVILILAVSIFWRVPRFLVFGASSIIALVGIFYIWYLGGAWAIEYWQTQNPHWFPMLIMSAVISFWLIAITELLFNLSKCLAMVSFVDID